MKSDVGNDLTAHIFVEAFDIVASLLEDVRAARRTVSTPTARSSTSFANGDFTNSEDIADLGGMEIAYGAYCKKLEADGFKGEEMKKQQQRFFRAPANFWRCKFIYSIRYHST